MRKWVVIAVVTLGIAGVLVFVWKTRRDPIEHHKKTYLAIREGSAFQTRVRDIWHRVTGGGLRKHYSEGEIEQLRTHQKALLKLGYLERREILVSNISANTIMSRMRLNRSIPGWRFAEVRSKATNIIVLLAVREEMKHWQELIDEAQKEWAPANPEE